MVSQYGQPQHGKPRDPVRRFSVESIQRYEDVLGSRFI